MIRREVYLAVVLLIGGVCPLAAQTSTPTADLTPAATPTKIVPGPVLEIEPPEPHEFGAVVVGTGRTFGYLAFNAGGSLLQGTASTPCDGFSVEPAAVDLGAGESAELLVTFAPPAAGLFTCELAVESNGGDVRLLLSGNGLPRIEVPIFDSPMSAGGAALSALLALSMLWRRRRGGIE